MMIHIGYYPCDISLIVRVLPELRELFKIKDSYLEEARQRLRKLQLRLNFNIKYYIEKQ